MSETIQAVAWKQWCHRAQMPCAGDVVTVPVASAQEGRQARTQSVRVRVVDQGVVLQSIVAHKRQVAAPDTTQCELWLRNRSRDLISFSIDRAGKIIASCWLPSVALDGDEFLFALRHLATEADRLEFLMTGSGE